jgi:hypothetical protein
LSRAPISAATDYLFNCRIALRRNCAIRATRNPDHMTDDLAAGFVGCPTPSRARRIRALWNSL